jgi:SAM-dependent methyltransferase
MSMARALRSPVAGAAVDAYDRHVGRYGAELAREMVRVTGVRAGQRALDVGCGTGALTVMLAEVLGAGNVAAIDPSERFVAACRDRAPGADLRVGIGEELPWSDAEFDAVLAQLVVYGMNDARRGAAEMRRVARPGGAVSACIWDFEGGMPLLRAVWDSALDVDAELARSFGADSPTRSRARMSSRSSGAPLGLRGSSSARSTPVPTTRTSMTSGTRSRTASAISVASTRRSMRRGASASSTARPSGSERRPVHSA